MAGEAPKGDAAVVMACEAPKDPKANGVADAATPKAVVVTGGCPPKGDAAAGAAPKAVAGAAPKAVASQADAGEA